MKKHNYGNRGKAFEDLLDYTNLIYKNKGIALINKRPTPVRILRTRGGRITQATFDTKSTVDYDGIYQGRSIVFEAKSTKGKSLPLSNITSEQIEYLEDAEKHGAISFLIVNMKELDKTYLISNEIVQEYVGNSFRGGRKSIPIKTMENKCIEVKSSEGVPVNYIKALNHLTNERRVTM